MGLSRLTHTLGKPIIWPGFVMKVTNFYRTLLTAIPPCSRWQGSSEIHFEEGHPHGSESWHQRFRSHWPPGIQAPDGSTRNAVEVVGINDLTDAKTLARAVQIRQQLWRFSSGEVSAKESSIVIYGKEIEHLRTERSGAAAVEGVRRADRARVHRAVYRCRQSEGAYRCGRKKVLISAPAKDEDATFVIGVNEKPTIRRSTISFPMHPARRTAWRRSPSRRRDLRHRGRVDDHDPCLYQ